MTVAENRSWDDIINNDPKVARINKQKPSQDIYNVRTLMHNPVSIYCIVWTIKNIMMHLSAHAVSGENLNDDLKKYYYAKPNVKEEMDFSLVHIIHELMERSLDEMQSYAGTSVDALVYDTIERYHSSI